MTGLTQLEIVHDDPTIGLLTKGSLFVVQFREAATADSLAVMEAEHQRLRTRLGRKLEQLTIIPFGASLPEGELKMAAARAYRTMSAHNHCAATVVIGVGFWASAARSALTGLSLLARPACPSKTFGDIPSALSWIGSTSGDAIGSVHAVSGELERWRGGDASAR